MGFYITLYEKSDSRAALRSLINTDCLAVLPHPLRVWQYRYRPAHKNFFVSGKILHFRTVNTRRAARRGNCHNLGGLSNPKQVHFEG